MHIISQQKAEELIAAIAKVADDIQSEEVYFSWSVMETCTCGLLVQKLGVSIDEVHTLLFEYGGSCWSSFAFDAEPCRATGLPVPTVFTRLHSFGLTSQDIEEIEFQGKVTLADYEKREQDETFYFHKSSITDPDLTVEFLRSLAKRYQQQLDEWKQVNLLE